MVNTQLIFSNVYHTQTNGQIEVLNISLVNLSRSLVGDYPKSWDQKRPKAEFAHNHDVNRHTGLVVYEIVPRRPIDLMMLPSTTEELITHLSQTHQKTHDCLCLRQHGISLTLIRSVVSVDLRLVISCGPFWVLTKDRCPTHEYNKLAARKIGPVEIVEKINSNVYHICLPRFIPLMCSSSSIWSRLLETLWMRIRILIRGQIFSTPEGMM